MCLAALVANTSDATRPVLAHAVFPTLEQATAALGVDLARDHFEVTGKGIGIAIIDSGIAAWHDDLYLDREQAWRANPRVVHFRDFTRPVDSSVLASDLPTDDYGHGTHVAGIIAGSGYDSDGRRAGVAPGAHLIGLKVLDADGHGAVAQVIAAIDYAIAVRERFNIRIINLSVATEAVASFTADPLAQAARRAVDAGIIVVTAAGNLGVDADGTPRAGTITSPGHAPWVITVGAATHQGTYRRSDDSVAPFSSCGPTAVDGSAKPDLVSYGVGITSLAAPGTTLYEAYRDYLLDGTRDIGFRPYLTMSGTSMAAPLVSGTIALILEANPSLTPEAVKTVLQYTAEDRLEDRFQEGAGLLNAHGALRLARFLAQPDGDAGPAGDTIDGGWVPWSRYLPDATPLVPALVPALDQGDMPAVN